jgi:hypothetical protein
VARDELDQPEVMDRAKDLRCGASNGLAARQPDARTVKTMNCITVDHLRPVVTVSSSLSLHYARVMSDKVQILSGRLGWT